tara:strand:- start:525 stop:1358 length:834 start_codon:yes stop_codon:yes gene_type:complete
MKRIVIALLAPLLLGGCLLSPGKFASELQLFADDQFAFTYDGEIQMLALSKLAEMANNSDESFVAECYDADFEMAECSEAEIAEQQAEWDAGAEDRRAKQAREAEKMRAVMGGIDPANPQAAQELAARLERQRGWQRVTYKGDGVFDVAFAVSGTLTHDFTFPTIEGMLGANAFVSINLRDGAQVRVDAPGFSRQQDTNPMFGGGSLAAFAAMAEADDGGDMPQIVMPEGTFTIVTDGRVLANNTDEGPAPHAAGQSLSWTIGATTQQAPTALIAFD